ncbi:hypothetical protein DB347_19525 [Opitutaceae bacterium EW11]|nr:hypothetical protein DB347_19525 [Opitutaceae bacterium EW11]
MVFESADRPDVAPEETGTKTRRRRPERDGCGAARAIFHDSDRLSDSTLLGAPRPDRQDHS